DKEKEILDKMESEFSAIERFAKGFINKAGEDALDYAKKDLATSTGSYGENALQVLKTDLENKKSEAVSALDKKIVEAKGKLLAELGKNQSATTAVLIKAIDDKIIELRGLVKVERDNLVKAQKDLITVEADRLEKEAKDALNDQIMASIN